MVCKYNSFFLWLLIVKKLINILYYCDYVSNSQYHCIMIGQQKNNRILYYQNYHLIENL